MEAGDGSVKPLSLGEYAGTIIAGFEALILMTARISVLWEAGVLSPSLY